jgi:GNAT superfamily N-acetyltransferase
MTSTGTLELVTAAISDPESAALVEQVQAEYTLRYGGPDEAPLQRGEFDAPQGAFFLGYVDGVAVAMGGWRWRPDVHPWGAASVTEVKRMYVAPAARRHGYARLLLGHLEDTARAAGSPAMVLETGTEQPEAIGLYVAAGYELIEDYGYYSWSPKSRCFGKRL